MTKTPEKMSITTVKYPMVSQLTLNARQFDEFYSCEQVVSPIWRASGAYRHFRRQTSQRVFFAFATGSMRGAARVLNSLDPLEINI